MPTRPAIAFRWITALVEPPIAALTRIAFSNASRVRIFDSFRSSRTMSTMRMPDRCASTRRRASTAGMAALCGRLVPSASAMQAIVDAVPIVLQVPAERDIPASAARNSLSFSVPALTCSDNCHTAVPEPMSLPLCLPLSIGPPVTTMAGTSTLAAPISRAGVVLSQPTSSTTPSIGLPRIDSSTSMLARLRVSMAVGRRLDSPLEKTGKLHREATGFEDAALDVLRELAEVGVAGRQLGPRVADPDDGLALEFVVGDALVLHPAPVHESVLVGGTEPVGRSELEGGCRHETLF